MELGENCTISRTSSLWMGHSFVWFFSIISVSFGWYSCPGELGEKLHNLKNNELMRTQIFWWLVVANRLEVCPYLVMWACQQLSSSHDPWMNHHLYTLSMTLQRTHQNFTYLKINGVNSSKIKTNMKRMNAIIISLQASVRNVGQLFSSWMTWP